MSFRTMVKTFLSAFNYVDENGKRKGFIFFANKGLTQDLENLAIDLKKNLRTLAADEKSSDEQKCQEFKRLIETCFKQAQDARLKHGSVGQAYEFVIPSNGEEKDGVTIRYNYKDPYRPAKFEKELINGLDAINLKLNQPGYKNLASLLKPLCSVLIWDINHYQPDPKTFRQSTP